MSQKTALITGASSGIGFELAKLFARDGYNLVLVARGSDKLEKAARELKGISSVEIHTISKDLSHTDSGLELFEEIKAKNLEINTLVNNAGFGGSGKFWEIDEKSIIGQIETNATSLTYLTRLFLPQMIDRKNGKILNVASTAAFQPGPLMAVYYATKAYVLSLGEALNYELKGTGVNITTLCPGPTTTNFQSEAGIENSKLFKLNAMTASEVAEIGYNGLMQGKSVVIPGIKNKTLAFLSRFIAVSISNKTIESLHKE